MMGAIHWQTVNITLLVCIISCLSQKCLADKPLGQECTGQIACLDPAAFCSGICICGANYYDDNGTDIGGNCRDISELQVSSILFSSISTTGFIVSWTPPSGKTRYLSGYTVEWRQQDTTVSGNAIQLASNATSAGISSGIISGQAYVVKITSKNSQTQSGVERYTSVSKEQATMPQIPGPLTKTTDISINSNTVSFSWTAPSSSVVSSYNVQMLDGTLSKATGTVYSTSASLSFSTIKYGYIYNIQITAKSLAITGNAVVASGIYTGQIKTVVIAPDQPTNVVCAAVFDEYIDLKWQAPGYPNGDLRQYHIEVYDFTNTLTSTINTGTTSTSFRVIGLKPGSYYRFRVFIENEKFNSTNGADTNSQCLTKSKMSDPPNSLAISTLGSRAMTIAWEKPTNTYSDENLGYVLQIKKSMGDCVLEQLYKCSDCTAMFKVNNTELCQPSVRSEMDITKSELAKRLTYTASPLLPDILYAVTVSAVNVEGRGHAASVPQRTLEEVPQQPTNMQITGVNTTSLSVTWDIAGPRPGPTTYTINVVGNPDIAPTKRETVIGFQQRSYLVEGLEEYWNYTVTVEASTSKGANTSEPSGQMQTLPAAPGKVSDFSVVTPNGNYTRLEISWKIPSVLNRNSIITSYTFIHNATAIDHPGTPRIFEAVQSDTIYSEILVVKPEETYTLEVFATNKDGQDGERSIEIMLAPPGVPKNVVEDELKVEVIPADRVTNVEKTSFKLIIKNAFLMQNVYGRVVETGLICCKQSSCTLKGVKSQTLSDFQGMPDYNTASKEDYKEYRVTKPTWVDAMNDVAGRRKRAAAGEVDYTLGVEDCTSSSGFCNGPLVADTPYIIRVVVCTNGGCLLSNEYGPFTTMTKSNERVINTGVVVGAVLGSVIVVLVIVFVIIIVYILRTKRVLAKGSRSDVPKVERLQGTNTANPEITNGPEDPSTQYMELDESSRVDTYDKIRNSRTDPQSPYTDLDTDGQESQYETPDLSPANSQITDHPANKARQQHLYQNINI